MTISLEIIPADIPIVLRTTTDFQLKFTVKISDVAESLAGFKINGKMNFSQGSCINLTSEGSSPNITIEPSAVTGVVLIELSTNDLEQIRPNNSGKWFLDFTRSDSKTLAFLESTVRVKR